MEYVGEAFKEAIDLVGLNSRLCFLTLFFFLILAFFVKKSEEEDRRKLGRRMLWLSIPGDLLALAFIVLIIKTFARGYSNLKASNGFSVFENDGRILYTYNGHSLGLLLLTLPVMFYMGVVFLVIGIKILKNGLGKAVGIIEVLFGIGYILSSILLFSPIITGISY